MSRMESLTGRVALVSGCASPIGREICVELAVAGASVVLVDIDQESSSETMHELLSGGHEAWSLPMDATDACSVTAALDRLGQRRQLPDIVVNSPPFGGRATLADIDPAQWRGTIDAYLRGSFLMMKAFMPRMRERRWGRFVSITPIWGKTAEASTAHVAAGSRGLIALSRSAALEVAPTVTVNCVCRGVETADGIFCARHQSTTQPRFASELDAQQTCALCDVASAVHWLCLPETAFVTGQTINADGGHTYH